MLLTVVTGCTGQTSDGNDQLSEDFDKTPPVFYRMPDKITASDTSAGWDQDGQKILLTGTVYLCDRQTPASNILLYYYHTDTGGRYHPKEGVRESMPYNSLGQTHGYIRGWVRTDRNGHYSIYTVLPGTYPNRSEPAHVHMYVAEPQMDQPYYIDDFVFDDDPLLTTSRRKAMENRGGSGIIRFVKAGGLDTGVRNIYLGANIPDYQDQDQRTASEYNRKGEAILSFTPFHVWGPDQGSHTCPICKYGWYQGVLYFVGRYPDWPAIEKWLTFLESESVRRGKYLKVYFVYGNDQHHSSEEKRDLLNALGEKLHLEKTALTYVPSFMDKECGIDANHIDPEKQNTLLIYQRGVIVSNYTDLSPTTENFNRIIGDLDKARGPYFNYSVHQILPGSED